MKKYETDQNDYSISKLLNQVDTWRHLPAYQLERRVDALIALVLPDIVIDSFDGLNRDDKLTVIPEFPLHRTVNGREGTTRVDFAVFVKEKKRIILLELKTDTNSIEPKQLENLTHAQSVESELLLNSVIDLAKVTKAKHKYAHLIGKLLELECIKPSPNQHYSNMKSYFKFKSKKNDFTKEDWANLSRKQMNEFFRTLEVHPCWLGLTIDCGLICPTRYEFENVKTIEFKDVYTTINRDQPHPMAHYLNKYLKEGWVEDEAGFVTPWEICID